MPKNSELVDVWDTGGGDSQGTRLKGDKETCRIEKANIQFRKHLVSEGEDS